MSDTPSDRSGDDRRREVEEKVAELEKRLSEVERALADRARLMREGLDPAPDQPQSGEKPAKT